MDRNFIELMRHPARPWRISGHRHARSEDDRRDEGVRRGDARSRATRSNFRCSTASAAICSGNWSPEGYRLRLYVPFGKAWYPYYMRRLAERPANVFFMLRNLFR